MLILTAQFFDTISDTGSDRFIVQDPDGGSPKVLGLVHLVLAGRGTLIALALVLTSGLAATIYKSPEIQPSLWALALAPLIAGFSHLDVRSAQREEDFRPESIATIVAELVSSIGTAVAAFVTRDHTAIIYGLVLRAATWVVVSHLAARTPYRWAYSRENATRFSHFAAPLFLNGLLLYFGSQGDRLIVGSGLGPEALGHYSAILLLAYYPASMVSRFVGGIHMPLLASARDDPARFDREEQKLAGRTVLISLSMVAGFSLFGPIFTPLLYGKDFSQPLQIFAMLAILQAGRLLRVWPTTAAVSLGKSSIVLLHNLARMSALPVALLLNHYIPSLESIIGGFIVGEIAAVLVALALLSREAPISIKRDLMRVGLCGAGCLVVLGWSWSLQRHWLALAPGLALATFATAFAIWRYEARVIGDSIRLLKARTSALYRR